MPGLKQSLEIAEADTKKRPREGGLKQGQSHLSQRMLNLWGLGKLSATAMQALAFAAHEDGCLETEVVELASLGAWGEHPANIHRDLTRLLQKKIKAGTLGGLKQSPEIVIKVPALDSKDPSGMTEANFHMFLPHLMISSFCDSYSALIESCFAPSKASNFWEQVAEDDPRLWDSPVAWEKANTPHQWQRKRQHTIPLWLHGDGVEFSTDSLLLFSFGGCLSGLRESQDIHRGLKQSHIIDNSFCLAAWPKSATAKETWAEVFQALAWSFQSLWEGYHPQIDWKGRALKGLMAQQAGKPLTKEGWRFYIWNYLGDLEYYANTLKLSHWQRHQFCWLCNCHKNEKRLSPWDFRDEPAWKLHDARGLKESPPSSHTLLTQIPGCSMAYRVSIDILHTLDLGVSSRVCGSVLHSWCYKEACNKAQAANNMREVWNSIHEKYKSMKVQERFTNLNLAQFTNAEAPWGQAPLLKGRAAEVRHLVPVLASVAWEKASASGGLKESHMAECLHSLACFYDTVSTADFFMTKNEAQAAFSQIKKCLRHYTWLKANAGNDILFQLAPKFHWAYHLGYMCQWQNPKTYWTYRQESWVGSMSTLAHSCAHGTKATNLSNSFCQKYLLGFQLRINNYL